MTVRKKNTVLSTVSFRYAILLSFSIFTILLTALILQSYNFINEWLPLIKSSVQDQEESGIHLKIGINAEEISVSFEQTSLFVDIIASYGELVFQGALRVDQFYDSFNENHGNNNNNLRTLSLEITDALEHSVWYHNNASVYTDDAFTPYPYELNSTNFDNIFRAAYMRYPEITALYVGMDNGLLRVYPEESLQNIFRKPHLFENTVGYKCSTNLADLSRYEHRCHTWYTRAYDNLHSVIFGQLHSSSDRSTKPHVDEYSTQKEEKDTGQVTVLTLSKSLHDTFGNFIGVLAIDVKDTTVQDLLKVPLLRTGYQFIVISDPTLESLISPGGDVRLVAYHNDCENYSAVHGGVCLLERLEPALFAETDIVNAIYNGSTGNASYYDGNTKWFVSYSFILTSNTDGMGSLSLVGVVPYDDIEEDYLTLKSRVKGFALYSLIICVCIVIVVFIVMNQVSAFFFKTLINPLHEFNSQAVQFSDRGLEEELGNVNTTSSSFKYRKMAKVTSSFQSLIYILEDINLSYFSNKFEVAYEQILLLEHIFHEMENEAGLGVILNNKGNILLKLFEIQDHEKIALDCFKEAIQIGHNVVGNFSKLRDTEKKTETLFRFHTLTLAGRYCNMGNYYQLVRDFKAAVNVYEMSIGLYTQAGDTVGRARARGNIGHTYLALKSRGKAKSVFEESFHTAVEKFSKRPTSKARELLQYASMNMGIFYRIDQRYERARPYFVYALELCKYISKAVLFRCYSELVYIYHHSIDPRAQSMVTLMKKDKNYYDTVTPRSIYIVIDTSITMKKQFKNTNTAMSSSRGGCLSSDSIRSIASHVELLEDEGKNDTTRIGFAKDCIEFVINSCLSGNDYISLTTFDQQISKKLVHISLQSQVNKDLVLDEIENIVKEENCFGSCALYDALQNTLLAAYGNTSFSNFESWVVVFTSGNDTASTRSLEEMEAIMGRININFIVVSLDTKKVQIKRNKSVLASENALNIALGDDNDSEIEGKITESTLTTTEEEEKQFDNDLSKRKFQFRRRGRSTFSTLEERDTEGRDHPLDCLFENSRKRKCLHLNSGVISNDQIRYLLFSAFEEVDINVFDTFMEAVI